MADLPVVRWSAGARLVPEAVSFIQAPHVGTGPSSCIVFLCVFKVIKRELNWKWMSQYMSQHPHGVSALPKHCADPAGLCLDISSDTRETQLHHSCHLFPTPGWLKSTLLSRVDIMKCVTCSFPDVFNECDQTGSGTIREMDSFSHLLQRSVLLVLIPFNVFSAALGLVQCEERQRICKNSPLLMRTP